MNNEEELMADKKKKKKRALTRQQREERAVRRIENIHKTPLSQLQRKLMEDSPESAGAFRWAVRQSARNVPLRELDSLRKEAEGLIPTSSKGGYSERLFKGTRTERLIRRAMKNKIQRAMHHNVAREIKRSRASAAKPKKKKVSKKKRKKQLVYPWREGEPLTRYHRNLLRDMAIERIKKIYRPELYVLREWLRADSPYYDPWDEDWLGKTAVWNPTWMLDYLRDSLEGVTHRRTVNPYNQDLFKGTRTEKLLHNAMEDVVYGTMEHNRKYRADKAYEEWLRRHGKKRP